MGYSVYYGPDMPRFTSKKRNHGGFIGAVLIFMVCAMAIGWALPQQTERFVQALFPWTQDQVQIAFAELRQDVREGQPLSDAVTAFCREIIDDAQQVP